MKKLISFLSLIFFSFFFFLWQGIFLPKEVSAPEKIFEVKKGQGLFEIGENLEKEGLIKNRIFFDFYVLLIGKEKNLQAGKYFLSSSMNIPQITKKIISGDIAKIKVTIPEGFTVKEIEEKLGIKLPGENLEGYLFPDTYYFPLDITGEEVVKIMRENFEKKIAPYREEIEKKRKNHSRNYNYGIFNRKRSKDKRRKRIGFWNFVEKIESRSSTSSRCDDNLCHWKKKQQKSL